jgi:hypothetical protein
MEVKERAMPVFTELWEARDKLVAAERALGAVKRKLQKCDLIERPGVEKEVASAQATQDRLEVSHSHHL